MRNLLLTLIFLTGISFLSSAKDRVTLVEHFTSAGCPPCATTNPIVDPIYEANADKIVLIKYQVNVNNCDPMYYENPIDGDVRGAYYNATSVPTMKMDGTFATFISNPSASLFESKLKEAYSINSTWNLDVNYSFDENYKNVTITMKITSLEDQTGEFNAHIALLEKEVTYDRVPGTNGEKTFYNVMKKMLPDANGTALDATWSKDQTLTITETIAIPYYYHKIENFAVAGFIQDNSTKKVMQAAYANSQTIDTSVVYAALKLPVFEDFEKDGEDNRLMNSQAPYCSYPFCFVTFPIQPPIGGANDSKYALYFRNRLNSSIGNARNYTLPAIDLQDEKSPVLSYYTTYCPYTGVTNSDSLRIEVSTDNEQSWSLLSTKGSADLNTMEAASTSKEELRSWKENKINLSSYAGQPRVIIRFMVVNGRNNSLGLDQIKVENENTSAIAEIDKSSNVSVFPTIAKDLIYISHSSQILSYGNIRLFSITGKEVYHKNLEKLSNTQETVNVSSLDAGIYLLIVNIDGKTESQKIIITK